MARLQCPDRQRWCPSAGSEHGHKPEGTRGAACSLDSSLQRTLNTSSSPSTAPSHEALAPQPSSQLFLVGNHQHLASAGQTSHTPHKLYRAHMVPPPAITHPSHPLFGSQQPRSIWSAPYSKCICWFAAGAYRQGLEGLQIILGQVLVEGNAPLRQSRHAAVHARGVRPWQRIQAPILLGGVLQGQPQPCTGRPLLSYPGWTRTKLW